MTDNKAKRKYRSDLVLCLAPLVYLGIAVIVVMFLSRNGIYPDGSYTYFHMHRGNLVYEALRNGELWPGLDPSWFNGTETMRYYAPLPAYVLALFQFLAGGDAVSAYVVFVGALVFLQALPWLFIGHSMQATLKGAVIGALWFFMPANLYTLFVQGDVAHSLCLVFMPLFFFSLWNYLQKKEFKQLCGLYVTGVLTALTSFSFAGFLLCGTVLFLICYSLINRDRSFVLKLLAVFTCTVMTVGVFLLPYLDSNVLKLDYSETMLGFTQSLFTSLNPFERLASNNAHYYFGLAVFAIAVLGILFSSDKKAAPGFATALLICFASTVSVGFVLLRVPGGQYLWIMKMFPIAMGLILLSFLQWKKLRGAWVVLICAALLADTVPSLGLIYGLQSGEPPAQRFADIQESTRLDVARAKTKQRLAVFDEGHFGSMGSYLSSDWETPVAIVSGANRESAETYDNIMQLNKAAVNGKFLYLFDRCKELGADTVLIRLDIINKEEEIPVEAIDAYASACGFKRASHNFAYRLYHLDTPDQWGTVNTYRALAIGSAAGSIALDFPAFEEAGSVRLDDYNFEELSGYDIIYLAGFEYTNRSYAEDLVRRLSENGVHIVISADGIPENRETQDRSFLGVSCNDIQFSNGYPELDTIDGVLYMDLFPKEHRQWETVFVNGLDEVWGTVYDNELNLPFYGTVCNDNIVVIGINLSYYYSLTEDDDAGRLLSHAMEISSNELPQRVIVPLKIEYGHNDIRITSPKDGVNTGIAYHAAFESSEEIGDVNNMLYVNAGVTQVALRYPYMNSFGETVRKRITRSYNAGSEYSEEELAKATSVLDKAGVDCGNISGDSPISRSECISLFVKALKISPAESDTLIHGETGYAPYVRAAYSAGLFDSCRGLSFIPTDGFFMGDRGFGEMDDPMSLQDASVILKAALSTADYESLSFLQAALDKSSEMRQLQLSVGDYPFEEEALSCNEALLCAAALVENGTIPDSEAPAAVTAREAIISQGRIVHAGGRITLSNGKNYSYTNSAEALLNAYGKGNRVLEFDFLKTSDGHLAAIHDWDSKISPSISEAQPLSLEEWLEADVYSNFTPLCLESLAGFMREHPDLFVMTDVKDDNVEAAAIIASTCPDLMDRFIIQIYKDSEYEAIRQLGFKNIVYTLYNLSKAKKQDTAHWREFAKEHELIGYTYPDSWRSVENYTEEMKRSGVLLFVHTVNDSEEIAKCYSEGFSAVYTDNVE